MQRDDAFSYVCNACNRCCRGKIIQINPYELARLARRLGVSASKFVERYTDDGVRLKRDETGTCVFLGEAGCTVHPDRPLVCRLYPLGRIVGSQGERFEHMTPHPETEGVYGADGRIADYLEQQGAEPYMAAADAYYALYRDLSIGEGEGAEAEPEDFLDLEGFVARECERRGEPVPETLEERAELHARWLAERFTGS
ncbi:YkgJ family cysteine cluster protein [Marinicauda salina]|uniref:YkgJ family cysteine cluster protein n=1 Tax=Marinicauda salina TaxID=2135793 RepID=A0A2U2BRG3_9PROT|nr:YkgJ family cysteine cluster protein [Marinicauda salina]PWE16579.1 YkgJ family cysteine cluster protein [Marinicauda salina]